MPQAIVVAATYISAEIGAAVVAAGGSIALAGTVANVAFAAVEVTAYAAIAIGINAAFAPKPPPMGAVSTPYKNGMPPRQSGFGRTRLSGPYMLFEAAEGGSFDVLALHDGECDGVSITPNPERYFLHDDEVTVDPTTKGVYVPGSPQKFGGGPPGHKVFIETRLGLNPNTALALPMAINVAFPGTWTSLYRGDGVACLALTCAQSRAKDQAANFPNGLPLASVVMRLQKVFDPRLGEDQANPSSYAWSANPVLALLAYLTNASGGMGLDYGRRIAPTIDYWKAAADDCDRATPLLAGGTEPRYSCGGLYQHDAAPADVINQILQSFDGWLSQRGDGALVVRPGRYVEPTIVFTDDHVVSYSVQHFLTDEEAVNQLVPSYTDPNSKYNVIDAGAWLDTADYASRGKLRSQTLPLPWVQSPSQSRRLAKRRMSRFTANLRGTVTTNLYGFAGLGERYLILRIAENAALNDIVVEVANVNMDLANLQVTYDWVQADPDIDAWNRFSEEQPPLPAGVRAAAAALVAPTITSMTAVYQQGTSSDQAARIKIDVSAPITTDVQWLIRWQKSGDTNWTEGSYTDIADGSAIELLSGFVPDGGDVVVEVAYVTAGGTSPWSASATITLTAPTSTFKAGVVGAISPGPGVTLGTDTMTGNAVISAGILTSSVVASEALTAGDMVNIWSSTGAKVRRANATAVGKPADGFVLASVAMGGAAIVYGPGAVDTALSGLTAGARYYLDTSPGQITTTAPNTEGSGNVVQEVGVALSATSLAFSPMRTTVL